MKDRWKWPVIALGIVIGGLVVWKAIPRSAANTNIQWKFGNQSLNLNVKKDMSDPRALIQKLMSTPFSKAGTLSYLNKDGIYAIDDPSIIPAIEALCPSKKGSQETPLQRQQRLQACLKSVVLRRLRNLASQHEAPFQYIGQEVTIGTPAATQPPVGYANVCENGGFLGHKIQINALEGGRTVTVEATGYYTCTGYEVVPDIQLNARDAIHLFDRPTRKLEKAVAVVL